MRIQDDIVSMIVLVTILVVFGFWAAALMAGVLWVAT